MSDKKFVQYTGKSPIEISIGELRCNFKPGESKAIGDVRLQNALLAMPLFRASSSRSTGSKPKAAKSPAPAPAPTPAAPAESPKSEGDDK